MEFKSVNSNTIAKLSILKLEEQVQTNLALMSFLDSKLNQTEFIAATYKRGLATVEEQLITYRKNEVLFSEEVAVLKREVACKDYEINVLKSEFEKVKQEKEGIEFKIEKFDKASKDLDKLLESQITDKSKKGLGYSVVPPPHPLIYNRPKKLDLSYSGLDEFKVLEFKGYGSQDSKTESSVVCDKKSDDSKENFDNSLEKEANIALIESWDNTQAMMEADFELAQRLQIRRTKERLLMRKDQDCLSELMNKRNRNTIANARTEEKKEKTDEHEEVEVDDEAKLKKHLVIVKDDDIAIDDIPLATKPPVIEIDREDLENSLGSWTKTKHGDTRHEDEQERVLWYGPKNSKQESNIVCDKKSDDSKENSDNSLVKEQVSKDTSSFVESSLNVDKETVFPVDKKVESVKPKVYEKPVKKSVRVNYNYTTKRTHPYAQRNMVPIAVLMKAGLKTFKTARTVNTALSKSTVFSAKSIPHFSKIAQSTERRPFQSKTTLSNKRFTHKVNTAKAQAVNTARPNTVKTARPYSAVVNAVRVNQANVVQALAWQPQQDDTGFVDSGCSRHMTGNIAYLSDFKEFDGGYVTFGGGAHGGRISGKLETLKTDSLILTIFDMKNIVPKESLTCLVAKATLDESMLWHRRLGHINFKNINKLVKDNLVRGLPTKCFENDQTCVACLKGKQHKASYETSEILKNFINEIENLVDKKVKIIMSDNGTEFKNKVMEDFCREKGIRREYNVARTPQQNGVAERRNRTLIEAARTMVFVVKPHNKTPYELFRGFKPALRFMKPFGCHVTILNTLENLGKFDGKSDEGFFVRYSFSSKAFRVYNTRTRRVEENLHIRFLKNKPMIEGNGPKWLFDIDSLTQSMNYVPVAAGTITNESAGTQEELNAGTSTQKEEISQDCIVMPIWKDASYFDSPSKNVDNGEPKSAADDQKQVEDGPDNENDEKDNFKLNTIDPSVNTASSYDQDSPKDMFKMGASHTLEATHVEFFSDEDEPEVDLGNITNSYWYFAFGRNTRDLGSFREETDKTTDLHQHLSRISTQKLETASQITLDAVTTHLKTASQYLQTASNCTDKTKIKRKPSKTGKHEHEEQKSTKEARDAKPKAGKVKKSKLTTFEARVRDYMAAHSERMERFENAIFKQREEINDRMTKMFGLLKELTTSKAPEKVLIREETKFPITKNVNSISLAKGEEERSWNMTDWRRHSTTLKILP
ncbi:zinc finger BED domain-containing protein RICESLEEPER 2-like protein [Tanacetum coccineum]